MLPRRYRLTPAEFFTAKGEKRKTRFFFGSITIKTVKNNTARFSITVSSKLDKRSVYRHRTKRVIMEAIGKYLPKIKKTAFILIRASRILNRKDRERTEKEIAEFFEKEGLI